MHLPRRCAAFTLLLTIGVGGCDAEPEELSEANSAQLEGSGSGGSTDDSRFTQALNAVRATSGAGVTVTFDDCAETVGVGLGLRSEVRSRVPARYILAGDPAAPVTPTAIRAMRCERVNVNGFDVGTHEIAQIGAMIVSPDGTGALNNYQFWYYTDSFVLALAMNVIGIPAQYRLGLQFNHTSCGAGVPCPVSVTSGPYAQPAFNLTGTAVEGDVVQTLAASSNWWYDGSNGTVKMTATGPNGVVSVRYGGGDFTVTTPTGSALASTFGTSTIRFPVMQRFNTSPSNIVTMTRQ